MLLIQRNMLWKLVAVAAVSTAAFGGAQLFLAIQPLIGFLTAGALSPGQFALAVLCAVPVIVYLAGPVTSAAAIAYCYQDWSRHRQIVVLRMAGLSDRAIAAPGIGAGLVATLFVAAMSLYFVPVAARVVTDMRFAALNRHALDFLPPAQMDRVTPELSLWFRERSETGDLQDVMLVDERKPDFPVYVFAKRAYTEVSDDPSDVPRIVLENGSYMNQGDAPKDVRITSFDVLGLPLTGLSMTRNWRGSFEEHIGALLDPPPEIRQDRANYGAWLEEGHRRIIMPLLTLSYAIFVSGMLLRDRLARLDYRMIAMVLGCGLWQALIVVSHSLISRMPETIPLYYAMAMMPGLIGGVLLCRPSRRPQPSSFASSREMAHVLE